MPARKKRAKTRIAEAPANSRMSYWIARTLHDERERVDVDVADIATTLGVVDRTVKRWEKGKTFGTDLDRAVAGYAYALGFNDGRELWAIALARWNSEEGAPPKFTPEASRQAAYAAEIRDETLRHRRNGPDEGEQP